MADRNDPVGVFDSGVGGISTLAEMKRVLPGEHFIYFGDTGNAPYGTKESAEVLECVVKVADHLVSEGCKALVIACNTATGVGAAFLRERLTIPVIGMEPALKPASLIRKDGKILVLATPVTLNMPKFALLMEKYGEGAVPVPCPGLMELVEKEQNEEAYRYLSGVFADYDTDTIDAVVLGCTHYVFLRKMIRTMLPGHIAITDGNHGTAMQLKRVLEQNGTNRTGGNGSIRFETSGDPELVLPVMRRLLEKG